jgi:hypothetical protein
VGNDWLEIIDQDMPSSLVEAEELCLERLIEMNMAWRDYEAECVYAHDLGLDITAQAYDGRDKWLCKREQITIHPWTDDESFVPLSIALSGDNEEAELQ